VLDSRLTDGKRTVSAFASRSRCIAAFRLDPLGGAFLELLDDLAIDAFRRAEKRMWMWSAVPSEHEHRRIEVSQDASVVFAQLSSIPVESTVDGFSCCKSGARKPAANACGMAKLGLCAPLSQALPGL